MKFHLAFDNLEFTLERPFAPPGADKAFSYRARDYEVSGDLEQLLAGFQDLLKHNLGTLNAMHAEEESILERMMQPREEA
jgi:hypothetical protein